MALASQTQDQAQPARVISPLLEVLEQASERRVRPENVDRSSAWQATLDPELGTLTVYQQSWLHIFILADNTVLHDG